MKSFAVIGTGAVGGFYGARLQRAGSEVHFLLHSDYDVVKKEGLRVDSKDGDFHLNEINAYNSAADMPVCDVVIIALKSYHNTILTDILPVITHPESCILLLQNGLGEEARIHKIVPECNIVGGLSFLCSNKVGPGHIRHLDYGRIAFGEYREDNKAAGTTPLMQQLAKHFSAADTPISLINDLILARWMKLVWNIPFNGLTVALDTTTDTLMANPSTEALARTLMNEVVSGAAALDRNIDPNFVEKMINDTRKMAPYYPSMKLDYDAGRQMETESIYGEPVRQAKAAGTSMPYTETLYHMLTQLQNRRSMNK